MSKILIVYGSSTGNTESIAKALGRIFVEQHQEVNLLNAADAKPDNLAKGYDLVLFGASAWGMEEVELQDDFAELYENFDKIGLKDVKVAAFASGDSSYEHFAGAVDMIEKRAKELGANIQEKGGLRVEGDASAAPDEIQKFAADLMKSL